MSYITRSRTPVAPSKMSGRRLTRNSTEYACAAWMPGTNHTSTNRAFGGLSRDGDRSGSSPAAHAGIGTRARGAGPRRQGRATARQAKPLALLAEGHPDQRAIFPLDVTDAATARGTGRFPPRRMRICLGMCLNCQFRILRLFQRYNGFRSETRATQSSARGGSAVCGTRDLAARSGGPGPAAAQAGGPGVDRPRSRSRSSRAAHRGRSAAPARRRG
jgi:hypothetical protein